MKNSFRILSAILILIAFSCSSVIGFAQSNNVILKNAYGLQKGQQNKHVSISTSSTNSDVLIENELEDNEESVSDSDIHTEGALFSTVIYTEKTPIVYHNRKPVSLNILYCVFRI